jgi:hypothetical protein
LLHQKLFWQQIFVETVFFFFSPCPPFHDKNGVSGGVRAERANKNTIRWQYLCLQKGDVKYLSTTVSNEENWSTYT